MSNIFLLSRQNQNQLPLYLRRKDIRSSFVPRNEYSKAVTTALPLWAINLWGGFEPELNRIFIFTTLSAIDCNQPSAIGGGVELESFPARFPSPKSTQISSRRTSGHSLSGSYNQKIHLSLDLGVAKQAIAQRGSRGFELRRPRLLGSEMPSVLLGANPARTPVNSPLNRYSR